MASIVQRDTDGAYKNAKILYVVGFSLITSSETYKNRKVYFVCMCVSQTAESKAHEDSMLPPKSLCARFLLLLWQLSPTW